MVLKDEHQHHHPITHHAFIKASALYMAQQLGWSVA